MSRATDLTDKRVVVMGLGRFGGGAGVARFLAGVGSRVLVTDVAPARQLRASLAQLASLPIKYRLGGHDVGDFSAAELVVVSPAVNPRGNRFLKAARDAGSPITSEIRLLAGRLPNRQRTIGVTGTAGKSTVTAMIGHILAGCTGGSRVHVGGNLGGSLLTKLDRIKTEDWVVLELSSFMLEGLAEDKWSPHVSVVTNTTPNHLDRHGTFEDYLKAKQTIVRYQKPHDIAVLGHTVGTWKTAARIYRVRPPQAVLSLSVPGDHNQMNAHMALVVCSQVLPGIATEPLADMLRTFRGLSHRLQLVGEHGGVRYFNDSKSTTPQSAMMAMNSFDPRTIHAILGGFDKGSDLRPLARCAAQCCRSIYTIGATGEALVSMCQAADGVADVVPSGNLDHAVAQIVCRAHRGDVVLLSPGCASWDQFENYEARGLAFAEAMAKYNRV